MSDVSRIAEKGRCNVRTQHRRGLTAIRRDRHLKCKLQLPLFP